MGGMSAASRERVWVYLGGLLGLSPILAIAAIAINAAVLDRERFRPYYTERISFDTYRSRVRDSIPAGSSAAKVWMDLRRRGFTCRQEAGGAKGEQASPVSEVGRMSCLYEFNGAYEYRTWSIVVDYDSRGIVIAADGTTGRIIQ